MVQLSLCICRLRSGTLRRSLPQLSHSSDSYDVWSPTWSSSSRIISKGLSQTLQGIIRFISKGWRWQDIIQIQETLNCSIGPGQCGNIKHTLQMSWLMYNNFRQGIGSLLNWANFSVKHTGIALPPVWGCTPPALKSFSWQCRGWSCPRVNWRDSLLHYRKAKDA